MKKSFGGALAAILSAAAAAAMAVPAAAAPAVTITHYHWTTLTFDTINRRAASLFMERNPGVEVNLMLLPEEPLRDILRSSLAAGRPVDSFALPVGQSAEFLAAGQMLPIIPGAFGKGSIGEVLSMWTPGAFEACGGVWEGRYYGIPFELSNYVGWVNVADMREAGLDPSRDKPRTWEEFAQVARRLTKVEAGRTVRNGFMCNAKNGVFSFLVVAAMMQQLGLDWATEKGLVSSMDHPDVLARGLRTYTDFVTRDRTWDPSVGDDDRICFAENRSAMLLTAGSWYVGLLEGAPVRVSDVEPFPYPRFADGRDIGGVGYGYCLFVTRQSRNPALAFRFLDAMASQGDEFIRYGYYQPRRWLSDGSRALDPGLARKYVPFYDEVFRPELAKTSVWLVSTRGSHVVRLVWQSVTRVIYEGLPVQDSVTALQREIRALFAAH